MKINDIKNIKVGGVKDAERILKAISYDDSDEIMKANQRNVGDLFFRDGKTYVWTEYKPGLFDWHIVNNKSKIQIGKGVNGVHGIKAVKKLYETIDKSYTDIDKVVLKRTPKGHWRLHYDDNDTGKTVDGDTFTEQELKADNVCYQDKKVVDNFSMMKDYMEFNSPDDVYFVQIIKRWKDNKDKPDADAWKAKGKAKGTYHSGAEYLDYWLIHSEAEVAQIKNEIIKVCSYNNARAYMTINTRSQSQVNQYIGKFKSRFSPSDPRAKNAEPILYGMPKTGSNWKNERFKVLLDIDTVRDSEVTIKGKKVNVWNEVEKRLTDLNIKVAGKYETPSGGLHLILNNKNNRNLAPFYKGLKDFDGGRDLGKLATVHPSEDIKMVLYSNVDTEGY